MAITLTAGDFAGLVQGYARVGSSLGTSFGSISAEPFAGFTLDALTTGTTAGYDVLTLVGNTAGSFSATTFTVNGNTWNIGSGTYNGSTATDYPLTTSGGEFVNGVGYTIDAGGGGPSYAGPTFVGVSTANGNTASFNITYSSSGRAAGDMLILGIETANQTAAAPSGFTQVPGAANPQSRGTAGAAGGLRGTVHAKTSDGTETTVVIADSGDHQYAVGLVVRPSGGATAVEVAVIGGGNAAASASGTFSGVTTTDDDCLIVTLVFTDRDSASASWSGQAGGAANLTERFDNGTAAGTGGGIAIYTAEKQAAGATGDITATQAASAAYASITLAIKNSASSGTHATSGALTGQIGNASGSATHVAVHNASGVLAGQLGSIAGSSARKRAMASSGALTGQSGAVSGSATRANAPVSHAASGALTGQLGSVSGSTVRFRAHPASGALVGQLGGVAGSAGRKRAFVSSGALTGPGASVVGSAARASGSVNHGTSGALSGQGATASGSAARFRARAAIGALVGAGTAVSGIAARARVHATSAVITGAGSAVTGATQNGGNVHVVTGNIIGGYSSMGISQLPTRMWQPFMQSFAS